MIEKIPVFRRPDLPVVGAASDERKKAVAEGIQKNFGKSREQINATFTERLRMLEYPKHDFEKAAIKDANYLLNQLLKELHLPTFDIPEANIYSVPKSLYQDMEGHPDDNDGHALIEEQVIVLNSENLDHPYTRIATLLHEMIHLKGFVSMEADDRNAIPRRSGLEAYSSLKRSEEQAAGVVARQFIGLNEAVVAELEKRLFKGVIDRNPHLAKEKVEVADEKSRVLRKKIASKKNITEDEFVYFLPIGKDSTQERWRGGFFSYPAQRKVLEYILQTVQKTYPEEFASIDDVFRLFLEAHFGGQLKPLARVIEDTFGIGSFRMVGTMTGKDAGSAHRVLAFLKKNTPLEIRK